MTSSVGFAAAPAKPSVIQPLTVPPFACDANQMTDAQIAAARGLSLEALYYLRTNHGLSNATICALSNEQLSDPQRAVPNPESDHPDKAVKFWLLRLRDEHGYIPPDGLVKAAAQVQRMRAARVPGTPSGAGISSSGWTWLGPGNIGGRIRSIVINPATPTTMFVGSVGGGIWKTTNGGASWSFINDFMANLAISTMVIDPTNSNIMYAGTGEGFYNGDAIQGAGIFKSTDGGATWTQLSSTNNSNFYWVNRLAVSPNASTILASTTNGLWRSTNGGSSWTQVIFDGDTRYAAFDPTNSNLAVASGSAGKAWYSTNGGVSWTAAIGLPTGDWLWRVELAYAPSNPSIVYAGSGHNSGEVWKSTDGGHSYALVNTGTNYGASWYSNALWVDPTNANIIVVGGLDLWRSTNGGTTLTQISQWWSAPNSAHADHHAIVNAPSFNGTTNTTVYFGNDGGIYRADNVYTVSLTSGWTSLNNNLGITQFYGAAGNATSGVIVGGTQDNGTLRYTGSTNNWTTMFGGDGGFDAADPNDSNYFYGEYIDLQIHRSANGGVSSSYIYSGITDAGSCANFIAPFILDPNNPNTLLAGGCSLWRSTNVKVTTPTWASIKSAVTNNQPISAIAVAPGNSNIIWVGYNDGEVYKTTNGTATMPTWTRMDLNSPNLPQKYVTRLTIDRNNSNIVYATYGGYSSNNVWRTTDSGSTWSLIVGSGATQLPQIPVHSFVISPFNSSWLYVGTEIGVFDSSDGGASWVVPQDGPANVAVDELFWMNNTLVAATHGRGLFSIDTSGTACYTLTTNVSPGGSGTITANPTPNCNNGTQYTTGTMVQLTANRNSGYIFTSWSGDASGNTNPTTVAMNANKTVTANFGTCNATAWLGEYWSNQNLSGSPTLCRNDAAINFDWGLGSPDPSIPADHFSVRWTQAINFATGLYRFHMGHDDGARLYIDDVLKIDAWGTCCVVDTADVALTSGNHTVRMEYFENTGAANATLWWESICYALATNANPSGSGTITANPAPNCNSGTQYTSGAVVTLTATANTGYIFSNWSGDASGSTNPTTVTMSASKNVTANFGTCYTLTTAVNPSGAGTINANPAPNCNGGTQYVSGTSVTLTATANSGYVFSNWSGDASGSTNPTTVTMSASKNVTANFTRRLFLPFIMR